MADIKVGDRVTYRSKPSRTGFQPMGLSGCIVIALCDPSAAVLEWRHPFINDGKPQRFGADLDCIKKE